MIDFVLLAKTIHRHPLTSAFDVALFAAVMMAATLFVVTYDLASFLTHLPPRERQVTSEEALLLVSLAIGGGCVFVWRRMLEERQDRARRTESVENRSLAMIDSLTSLPNRRKFMAALEKTTSTANAAVCLLDLNDFKQVNDGHGHQAGDAVLRAVAERFKGVTRDGDLLARLGGDEFALIAHGVTSSKEAMEIASRFVTALSKPIQVDGRPHFVGVSLGVAFHPEDGRTPLEILHAADVAMYQAKELGHSTIRLFRDAPRRSTA